MAFVVTVFIYLQLNPPPFAQLTVQEGAEAVFLGEVYHKEYKNGKQILYLNHIREYDHITEKYIMSDIEGILCYMDENASYEEPMLGSTAVVKGKAEPFREVRNYGGFDAKRYYKTLGLDFQLYNTEILTVSDTYSKYRESLYRVRRYFENIFDMVMSERDASIMKAMVLGNKAELDDQSKMLFQKSGISHIFAISGLHITFIGMGINRLLRKMRLSITPAAVISVIAMLAYGEMTGMSSSAFRAVFMFALKMLAKTLHRTYDMLNALALAAVLLIAEQPLYIYHTGFLLSFGAILGICCVSKVIKGMGVFLIHFPIMLCTYYEFPIYSFLLNLIVMPSMTLLMSLGMVCLGAGSIPVSCLSLGLAKLSGFGCHVIIEIFELLSTLSLKMPFASWITGRPDNWKICCFYAVILFLHIANEYSEKINKNNKYASLRMRIGLPAFVKLTLVMASIVLLSGRNADGLKIAFLDVGQGDCIWIETPSGEHYLIDAGSSSEKQLEKYTVTPYLKYMGTDRLDAVFLTHLDSDHTSALVDMLENGCDIKINRLVIAGAAMKDEAYYEIKDLCSQSNTPLFAVNAGDRLDIGKGVTLEIMHPASDYQALSRNAYSLVMRLAYRTKGGEFSALFTGDVEADGEAYAAEGISKYGSCQLYKASHHGSRYSNTQALLQAAMPDIAVISCGEGNSYGHPHDEVIEALDDIGCRVFVTKDTGAVMVRVKDGRVGVKTVLGKTY